MTSNDKNVFSREGKKKRLQYKHYIKTRNYWNWNENDRGKKLHYLLENDDNVDEGF